MLSSFRYKQLAFHFYCNQREKKIKKWLNLNLDVNVYKKLLIRVEMILIRPLEKKGFSSCFLYRIRNSVSTCLYISSFLATRDGNVPIEITAGLPELVSPWKTVKFKTFFLSIFKLWCQISNCLSNSVYKQ